MSSTPQRRWRATTLPADRRRRAVLTAGLVVVAFAAGLAIAVLLSRRDARERDNKRVAELSAELTALADPAGVGAAEIERGPLCCHGGTCTGLLVRRQQVNAPPGDVVAAYRRALERGGWQPEQVAGEPDASYFAKDVAGRRASASVRVGGQPATAVIAMYLEAESC